MRAFLLSIITVLFVLPAFSQFRGKAGYNLEPVEDKLDTAKHYQKVLIVAEGNMQVRMYTQNLAQELAKYFKDQKIECKYEYLGDPAKTDVNSALETAKTWNADAIMRLVPSKSEEIMVKRVYNNNMPGPGAGLRTVLINVFNITLTDAIELVWSAKLSASYEGAEDSVYRRAAKGIMHDLKKQNVISGKI